MIRYLKVTIQRNELHRQTVTVPAWELALLQALYGGDASVSGHLDLDRATPEPEAEYDRLERKYRDFRDEAGDYSGQSVVAEVYGKFQTGIRALTQEIQAAVEAATDAVAEAEPKASGKGKGKGAGAQQEAGAAARVA